MNHTRNRAVRIRGAVAVRAVILLTAITAGCSTQGYYSPPEPTAHCAGKQMICTGYGGRAKSSDSACRCGVLTDYQ